MVVAVAMVAVVEMAVTGMSIIGKEGVEERYTAISLWLLSMAVQEEGGGVVPVQCISRV